MKNLIYTISLVWFLASCGGDTQGDKQAQLDSLLKEQVALNEKIKTLKAEIKKTDGDKAASKLVVAESITPSPFRHYVEVQARVDGDESVSVSPRTQGTVTHINVHEGDKVEKGQILAISMTRLYNRHWPKCKLNMTFQKIFMKSRKICGIRKSAVKCNILLQKITCSRLKKDWLLPMNNSI